MLETSQLTLPVSVRPRDVYNPFDWTWGNLARWVFVLFVFLVCCDRQPAMEGYDEHANLGPVTAAFGLFLAFAVLMIFVAPLWRVWRSFQGRPFAGRPYVLSIGGGGLHMEMANVSADYKWSAFSRVFESRKAFYILRGRAAGFWIPKRCVQNQTDIVVLRDLIRRNFEGKIALRSD